MASQLFRTKNPDHLIREAQAPDRLMKRSLTAFDLTCLGIGAIIGAGIFALAGTAAAGEQVQAASIWKTPVLNFIQSFLTHSDVVFGRPGAGPAVVFSFVIAAIACGFAALCYAELASMIPVSGSAYTYSYATLGEIVAWIIGWDLILEYAVGNMAVAVGWSGYFVQALRQSFRAQIPALGGQRSHHRDRYHCERRRRLAGLFFNCAAGHRRTFDRAKFSGISHRGGGDRALDLRHSRKRPHQ